MVVSSVTSSDGPPLPPSSSATLLSAAQAPSSPESIPSPPPKAIALRFNGVFAHCLSECPRVADDPLVARLSDTLNKSESNAFLPFYAITTRPVAQSDSDLLRAQSFVVRRGGKKHRLVSFLTTSNTKEMDRLILPPSIALKAFIDSGASCNVCSLRFARAGRFHIELAGAREISAFRGESTTEQMWRAVFVIEIAGHTASGEPSTMQILTSALIVAEDMETPLILGSEFQHAHGVVSDPRRRIATLRDSEGALFKVDWADMGETEYQQLRVASAQLVQNRPELTKNAQLAVGMSASDAQTLWGDEHWPAIPAPQLLHEAVTHSRQFLAYAQRHRQRLTPFVCRTLHLMTLLYRSDALRLQAQELIDVSYASDRRTELPMFEPLTLDPDRLASLSTAFAMVHTAMHQLVHESDPIAPGPLPAVRHDFRAAAAQFMPASSAQYEPGSISSELATALAMCEAMTETDVAQHSCLVLAAARSRWPERVAAEPLFIPEPPDEAFLNDPSVDDLERMWRHIRLFKTIESDALPDEGEHADLLQCLREQCTRLSPHLRPRMFPVSLWPLVADCQKPGLIARWDRFSDERIEWCLNAGLEKVRIYDGNPERLEQKSFMLAQVVANLDRFFHPSDDEVPCIPNVEMEIELTDPNCRPVAFQNRRLQPWERLSLRARIAIMTRQGLVEPTKSAWNNPVHMVANRDRIKAFQAKYGVDATTIKITKENEEDLASLYRMTGDFRLLNALSHLERWPLPRIMDLIDSCVERSDRYSCGDLMNAFFLIRLKESCRHLTAFGTPDAHLQYAVMPQGVKSAANVWARTIQTIMADLLYTYKLMVYQDDIVNTAKNFGEHFRTQQAIYDRLGANGIVFKPSKTTLNFTSQKILGHIMSAEGRGVDPGLVETILKLGPPRNLHDVQSMLGLAKVATEYIPSLSALLAPIQALAKKYLDIPKLWAANPQCDEALAALKAALISPDVLMIPDITKPFRLYVDACRVGRGLGAVLKQCAPGDENKPTAEQKWKPVAYWSRALSDAERNFSATELETTGLHGAICHWYPFLFMTFHPFDVYVDHYALVYLVTKMGKSVQSHQRLTRLCLDLQGYSFNVHHIKGTDHLEADAVSRLLHHDEVAFVHNEDTLRTDFGPLTEEDRANLRARYDLDAEWIIRAHERKQVERAETLEQPALIVAKALISPPVSNFTLPPQTPDLCAPNCRACGNDKPLDVCSLVARETARPLLVARASLAKATRVLAPDIVRTAKGEGPTPHKLPILSLRQLDTIVCDSNFNHGMSSFNLQRFYQYLRDLHGHVMLNHTENLPLLRAYSITLMLLHQVAIKLTKWEVRMYETYRLQNQPPATSPAISRSARSERRQLRRRRERKRLWLVEEIRARELQSVPRLARHGMHGWRSSDPVEQHYQHMIQMEPVHRQFRRAVVHRTVGIAASQLRNVHIEMLDLFGQTPRQQAFVSRTTNMTPTLSCEPIVPSTRADSVSETVALAPVLRFAPARVGRPPTARTLARRQAARNEIPLHIVEVPHYGTRRATAEYEAEEGLQQELLDNRLEEYQFVHGQVYLDPTNDTFYEVIDTKMTRRQKKNGGPVVTVIAWPINADGEFTVSGEQQANETLWQERPYLEVQALIDDQTRIRDPLSGARFPVTPDEWTARQLDDEWCSNLMRQLDGSNHFNLHPTGRCDDRHYDRLHRPIVTLEDGTTTLGPLTRTATVHNKVLNGAIELVQFTTINQIVVPLLMRPAVLHQQHDLLGHAGSHRMTKTVRLKYWWDTVVRDCITHSQQCRYCERRKARNHHPKVPVQEYPAPPSPHHTAHIDLTGPFNISHGNKYILVYKCALTKWVECVPVRDKTAPAVVTALTDIFMRHGAPVRMVMDNGKEFKNRLCKDVCAVLETKMIHITPVNPRSNGLAENQMRTLKDMVSAHVNAKQNNWSEHLSAVAHVYNTTVNHAVGYTPFYLNYGRQCATPDTEYLTSRIKSLDDHALSLAMALKIAWTTIAGSTWHNKTDVLNRRTVQPLEFKHYELNQLVFIKRIPRRFYVDQNDAEAYALSSKLQARYAGPYRIIGKRSDVVYTAMVHGKPRTIHAVNMKPAMVDLHVAVAERDPAVAAQQLEDDRLQEIQADALLLQALRGVELNPRPPPQPEPPAPEPTAPRIKRKLSPVLRPNSAPRGGATAAITTQTETPEHGADRSADAIE